jgi:uncharacterized protein YhhL (DUF1145 family)
MNPEVLRQGKMALNILWLVLAASFVLPTSPVVTTLRAVFVVMLAAHALEFAIFFRKLSRLPGSLPHHLGQMLLYGFFHLKQAELQSGETGSH